MNTHLIFITLIGLTGVSAWAASAQDGNLPLLLGLGCVKLLLVAFYFMELKHAHLFWKSAIVLFVVYFLTASWLVF